MNQTKALQNLPFEQDEWQKLYYRYQQQYILLSLYLYNVLFK